MTDITKYYDWVASRRYSVSDLIAAVGGLRRYLGWRLRYRNLKVGLFFAHRGAEIIVGPNAEVSIGRYVRLMRDFTGHFYGKVTIGNNVYFNRGCYISAHESVTIGSNCLFGEQVSIHDENHVPGRDTNPIDTRGYVTAPVVIGNNVWIGAKVTILQGVRIGDNAVIGANAVVTRDVPAYSIAVGIPARVIREI